MSSYARALLFCVAILVAPFVYLAGESLAGTWGAVLLSAACVAGTGLYAYLGDRDRLGGGGQTPLGPQPS